MKKEKIIIIVICSILLVLMGVTVYNILAPTDTIYGKRLDEAVSIDGSVISKIKEELSNSGNISAVNYKTNVKIMKFFITTDLEATKAQEKVSIIMDNLNEKVVNFYDIEVYFTNESNTDYPMIGYHSKNSKEFKWVINKEDTTNEE